MQVVTGAWKFAIVPLVLGPPLVLFAPGVGIGLFFLGVAILWFYRDPAREPPANGVLAPADGRISVIRREDDRLRVGVFMNVTDVHVNRAPIAGRVTDCTYRPGAHRPAFSKDSDRNERLDITIEADAGEYVVSLIAGTVARRITPYVTEGARLDRGQRIGHIAFGSRADVLLPPEIDRETLAVRSGDRVRAGETVLLEQ